MRRRICRASRCTLPCLTILNPKKGCEFQQRLKRQKNPPHFILCSPVACNLLHEINNPRHKGNGIRCELSCIKMHATKNADRCSLIGIVFGRYYRIICVLFFVKKMFPILLEYLKFHQMHQVIVVCFLQHSSNHQHISSMHYSYPYYHL